MIDFGRFIGAMPLAGALLLASCGGGGGASPSLPSQQSGLGIAVGEPSPGAGPDLAKFTEIGRAHV
jgi:hypothetical protein